MRYLCYRRDEPDLYGEIIPELRSFFNRIRSIKQSLRIADTEPYLNRIQRERCLQNLYSLERAAREFEAIDYREDYYHLYRQLGRYLRLETRDLKRVLGYESSKKITLFVQLD